MRFFGAKESNCYCPTALRFVNAGCNWAAFEAVPQQHCKDATASIIKINSAIRLRHPARAKFSCRPLISYALVITTKTKLTHYRQLGPTESETSLRSLSAHRSATTTQSSLATQ